MDWKEMLGQADALFKKASDLLASETAPPEEKSHVQEILDDAMKLKQQALQLKTIADEAPTDEELAAMRAGPQTKAKDGEPDNKPPAEPGEFKGWNEWLYAIWLKQAHGVEDRRLKWFKEEEAEGPESKQMVGNVGARGGFLIAPQFLPEMQGVAAEDSIVRPFATIIRMTGRQLSVPVLDQTQALGVGLPNWFGGMKFYWADEASEKTETEAKFRKINLVAKKLIGYTNASDELLDDAAISLADFLSGPLGFAGGIAWMEDYAFLDGRGGGEPRGVINAPATLAPTRQAAGLISYVDCINMLQNFLPSARGRWVVSQSAMASLIQMSGPSGNASYVWQPNAREGPPGLLFGFPVHWSEKPPTLGTRGDIGLYDFRYYLIGDRQATTIESSKYPRWVYDETSWRVVHRVDGQPWLSAPLTYQDATTQVSPFVVLGGVGGS